MGDEKKWEEIQNLMEEILKELKIEYKRVDGEAAFLRTEDGFDG